MGTENVSEQRTSTRQYTYRDYTAEVSPKLATWILAALLGVLLAAEAAVRAVPPRYERTAGNSMHGLRTLFQEAADDPNPKIIAVGDSTLVGNGVYSDHLTVMGRMESVLKPGPRLYNLALPGGDSSSSLVVLDALRRAHIRQVDRVLIEVVPSKFIVNAPAAATPADAAKPAIDDIDRYIPFARPAAYNVPYSSKSYTDHVETTLEYGLGNISALYRNRDYLRTRFIGNYPTLWLMGHLLPARARERLFPAKAQGNNRLAARSDDGPYDPATAPSAAGLAPRFTRHIQGDYLEDAVAAARSVSGRPPILVVFPTHYEYYRINPAQRAAYLQALTDFNAYVQQTGTETGSEVILVDSTKCQDPGLWTRTPVHFNIRGSAYVWDAIRPQICRIFPCRP